MSIPGKQTDRRELASGRGSGEAKSIICRTLFIEKARQIIFDALFRQKIGVTFGDWGRHRDNYGLLWDHFSHTRATLGSLCGRSWHLMVASRALCGHFGITYGIWGYFWEHFGVTLGPIWGHFGYQWVTSGHVRMTLESFWNHFGYMKARFQKKSFPTQILMIL